MTRASNPVRDFACSQLSTTRRTAFATRPDQPPVRKIPVQKPVSAGEVVSVSGKDNSVHKFLMSMPVAPGDGCRSVFDGEGRPVGVVSPATTS